MNLTYLGGNLLSVIPSQFESYGKSKKLQEDCDIMSDCDILLSDN